MNATILSVLLLAAGPAAPKALLHEQSTAASWRVGANATPDDVRLVSASSPSGRTLIAIAATNATRSGFDGTEARIVGADGKTIRTVAMPGMLPVKASLSSDGTTAAVIASPANDPNAEYALLVFDADGAKLFRKDVDPAYQLLAGNSWIALWAPPATPGMVEEHEDEPAPAQVAEPSIVYGLDGRTFPTGEPLGGALCALGDAIASVTPGRLALWRENLTRKGKAELALEAGIPFCSADGSTVAVGDFAFDADRTRRTLQIYDATGKKTGALSIEQAPLGVDAALSADGKAIAATAAAPDVAGDVIFDSPLEVIVADRAGKTRVTFRADRRHPTERAVHLATSNGGKRTAFARRSGDPSEAPELVTLIDGGGRVIWEAERAVTGLALDANGEWLTIHDATGVSRLRVSALSGAVGTAR